MDRLSQWVAGFGPWSIVVFIGIYAAATVLFLPGWIFSVTSGAAFGLVWGVVAASLGSTTGAALAFLVARYVARDAVARRIERSPRFAAVDRAMTERGWKIVALLRLSPAVPFNVQNYLCGLTGIRFVPYVLTSWITMLPGAFVYVYIGYLSRAGLEARLAGEESVGVWTWVLRGVGLVATLAVAGYIARLARRAIHEQTGLAPDQTAAEPSQPAAPQAAPEHWPWTALASLGLGLFMLATALWTVIEPDGLRQRFRSLFSHVQQQVVLNHDANNSSVERNLFRSNECAVSGTGPAPSTWTSQKPSIWEINEWERS